MKILYLIYTGLHRLSSLKITIEAGSQTLKLCINRIKYFHKKTPNFKNDKSIINRKKRSKIRSKIINHANLIFH